MKLAGLALMAVFTDTCDSEDEAERSQAGAPSRVCGDTVVTWYWDALTNERCQFKVFLVTEFRCTDKGRQNPPAYRYIANTTLFLGN